MIFLHGGPGGFVSTSAIDDLGRLAEHGYDVYLYDQVGSGLSDRLDKPKDYSFLGHVADLREIVTEEIGAERAVLIGQSYGGQLISYFVAHHPVYEHAALAPRGTYRFIEGVGHKIRWERPDGYIEEILRFLDEGAE